ncbi:MAG: hypothetical protein AB8B97_24590 [Granulosicoccus sp.]
MKNSRLSLLTFIVLASSANAAEHSGASPASHMQLKDSSGNIACFAYDTDETTDPIARDCPEGTYTEQLFNQDWAQISQRSVVIGSTPPPSNTPLLPIRVEKTCVWDEGRLRDNGNSADAGFINEPWCSITCPAGVAIDGEATATIPGFFGTDDDFIDRVSSTSGTGTPTIRISMDTDLSVVVAFERFEVNQENAPFTGYTYVIEAAAVCL